MSDTKKVPGAAIPGTGETARAAAISTKSIHNAKPFQKPADPGAFGLAFNIAALPTSELRQQVELLTAYGPAFGYHGRRRRDLAMRELRRRMAVQS